MERSLTGAGVGMIGVCAVFDEELAEAPVAVERGTGEIEVLSEGVERFAVVEEKPQRGHIAVAGAPPDERDSVLSGGGGRQAGRDDVEDEVGPSVRDTIQRLGHSCTR
jgi:hypothetical protein